MELDYVFSGSPFWARQSQNQGPTLDPQRNNLDFYKNSLNQNHQLFNSRYVAEESEEEDNQGFEIGSHEFENLPPCHNFFHGGVGAPSQMKRSNLSSSVEDEYAPPRLGGKMGEIVQSQQQELRRRQSRVGLRNSGGEIVEVQGGHIVRSTGRKDRHSKVCTSKGPRDRRVRLSAHTAIQFYDVQDRLGYDRPSKAVDWLIKKAKAAIDELAELPAWQPTTTATNSTSIFSFEQNPDHENTSHHELSRFDEQPNDGNSSLLPPSFNSDSIADTIKSFFPMGASSTSVNSNSTGMQFHQSFPQPDLLSNSNNQSQDLRLSLQSFRDPILQHHHHHQQQNEQDNSMFLDGSGWPERMVGWSGGGSGDAASGGFVFNSPPTQTPPFLQTLLSQTTNNQLFNSNSQRGPLQSSYTPSIRAWVDQPPFAGAAIDHTSSMSGFTSGFSGFLFPARFQGEQEEHDGISDKPSSASSDSRH